MPGGFRPGAGRPKGARNRATIARENLAEEVARRMSNMLPSMSMLGMVQTIAREAFAAGQFDTALSAAREVLPYLHSRMAAVAAQGADDATADEIANDPDPDVMSDESRSALDSFGAKGNQIEHD